MNTASETAVELTESETKVRFKHPSAVMREMPEAELSRMIERVMNYPGADSLTVDEVEALARGPRTMRLAAKGEMKRRLKKKRK